MEMTITESKRYCDRCGVLLTGKNNKLGFKICDKCNGVLEQKSIELSDRMWASFDKMSEVVEDGKID